jgi:hypothetical protein
VKVKDATRTGLFLAIGGAVSMGLALFVLTKFSWESLGMALFLIVIWTPLKGLLYRRLGGRKPYQSALLANASSELAGLPFTLAIGFWPLMGVSFVISAAIESVALVAMRTAKSVGRSVAIATYGSAVVHLITAGFFVSQRNLTLGLPLIVVGILLFHLPAIFPGTQET